MTLMQNKIEKSESAYKTIGEVAKILELPQYVIRFWQAKFSHIKPVIANKRRYYPPEEIEKLKAIKELLYDKKYTIKGVQQQLIKNIAKQSSLPTAGPNQQRIDELKQILKLLYKIRNTLEK